MTIGLILLDIDSVVSFREDWRIIIAVSEVDVDQNTGAETGTA